MVRVFILIVKLRLKYKRNYEHDFSRTTPDYT